MSVSHTSPGEPAHVVGKKCLFSCMGANYVKMYWFFNTIGKLAHCCF